MHNSALDTAVFYKNLHESGTIPDYEAILEKSYRRLINKGDTVIDIGAHGGRHTAPFAELVGEKGRVIAFEPLPEKAAILRSRFSQLEQVSVREVALGDKSGQFEYNRVENAPEESGLKQRIYNIPDPKIEKIIVSVTTLDQECGALERIDFIKIDVEGGEIDCLNGCKTILQKFRPFISVEYGYPAYSGYGNTVQTLFELASGAGYVLGDLFGHSVHTAGEWSEICDRSYWDFFMVPAERAQHWSSLLKG